MSRIQVIISQFLKYLFKYFCFKSQLKKIQNEYFLMAVNGISHVPGIHIFFERWYKNTWSYSIFQKIISNQIFLSFSTDVKNMKKWH